MQLAECHQVLQTHDHPREFALFVRNAWRGQRYLARFCMRVSRHSGEVFAAQISPGTLDQTRRTDAYSISRQDLAANDWTVITTRQLDKSEHTHTSKKLPVRVSPAIMAPATLESPLHASWNPLLRHRVWQRFFQLKDSWRHFRHQLRAFVGGRLRVEDLI